MSLIGDVADYENWLRKRCDVVEHGLCKKHDRMASDAFKFFRATSFRFARKLDKWLPQLGCAPQAPSVGDAHIENWGTWRDGEGRLVWGVNDFDDAAVLPYTYDLLRLATSAVLAPGLPSSNGERAAAITSGYRQGLNAPGPRFIDDEVPWMQALVNRPAAKAGAFAADLADIKRKEPPDKIAKALRKQLPKGTDNIEFCVWQRGGGSLGRPRYLAIGEWRGGLAVREAKALVPSAWSWAFGADDAPILFESLATGKYRSPDPFLHIRSNFIIRRIAPDSNKIDLAAEEAHEYGPKLLSAMGVDLASIHLAEGLDADLIVRDLNGRGPGWLLNAAQIASEAVCKDFEKWRSYHRTKSNM